MLAQPTGEEHPTPDSVPARKSSIIQGENKYLPSFKLWILMSLKPCWSNFKSSGPYSETFYCCRPQHWRPRWPSCGPTPAKPSHGQTTVIIVRRRVDYLVSQFLLLIYWSTRSNPFNHWKIHFYSYNICINNSKTSPHKTRHELLLCENCKIGAFVTRM